MRDQKSINDIRKALERDNIPGAISKFKKHLGDSSILDKTLQESAKHYSLIKQVSAGTLSVEEAVQRKEEIRKQLFELLSEIDSSSPAKGTASKEGPFEAKENPNDRWIYILMTVLSFGIAFTVMLVWMTKVKDLPRGSITVTIRIMISSALGLSIAFATFGLIRSFAVIRKNTASGAFEFGGGFAGFLAVFVLFMFFSKESDSFDLAIKLKSKVDIPVEVYSSAVITVSVNGGERVGYFSSNGTAVIHGLSAELVNTQASFDLKIKDFELVQDSAWLMLKEGEMCGIEIRKSRHYGEIFGHLFFPASRTAAQGIRVCLDYPDLPIPVCDTTDGMGNFEIIIPPTYAHLFQERYRLVAISSTGRQNIGIAYTNSLPNPNRQSFNLNDVDHEN